MRAALLDALYLLAALITTPWWMTKARAGWPERFGNVQALPPPTPGKPRVLIHGVSLGEINATRPIVEDLETDHEVIVCATTDTGLARARELYADRLHVVRYPLDASWAVRRFLDRVRPRAAALVELEVWPNFLDACARRGIPVGVVNGRLSARSFKGYRRARFLLKRYFERLAFAGVQTDEYRERFAAMGAPPERCRVAGNTKWDVEPIDARGAQALAAAMGIDLSRPLVVAGSTAPGEDALVRASLSEGAQLLCAPRRPEWREEAGAALAPCVRRTAPGEGGASHGRFLLDTMGELSLAYALADVVVVGRSFGELHGSDPMEPAAMGRAVVIGPAYGDFAGAVEALREAGGIVVTDRDRLAGDLGRLLKDREAREAVAGSALAVVERHRGAGGRYAAMVRDMVARANTAEPEGSARARA